MLFFFLDMADILSRIKIDVLACDELRHRTRIKCSLDVLIPFLGSGPSDLPEQFWLRLGE
ncbi:hypothetical protein D3C86_2141480 [compost metagenome]